MVDSRFVYVGTLGLAKYTGWVLVLERVLLHVSHDSSMERAGFELELAPVESDGFFFCRYGKDADGAPVLLKSAEGPGREMLAREIAADKVVREARKLRAGSFALLRGWDLESSPARVLIDVAGQPLARHDRPLRGTELKRAARGLFELLMVLAEKDRAHGDISPTTVFWDGVRVSLTGFGESRTSSGGSAADVRHAAQVIYQAATGRAPQQAESVMRDELAAIDPELAAALVQAFATTEVPTASEIHQQLRTIGRPQPTQPLTRPPTVSQPGRVRSGPAPTITQRRPAQDTEEARYDREFAQLRGQQREARRAVRAATEAKTAWTPPPQPRRDPPPPAKRGRVIPTAALVAVVLIVILLVVLSR